MDHQLEHQMRNLLSIVIGYANLMEESLPSDDSRREDLREILRAAQQAIDLLTEDSLEQR
jgi:signal transduction histidine kinase